MQDKATLRSIAAESGFAVTTVSRALADDPKIAEATRRRIGEIARAQGYVPDRAARHLRTGKTNVIALVMTPHDEILGFRGSMIAGVQKALQGTAYHIHMAPYDLRGDPLEPVRHIVQNRLADGILFTGTTPDDPRVAYLNAAGFAFVSYGRTDAGAAHAWCDFDNHAFAVMAVERLAARGRKSLFLLPPKDRRTYGRHMREGFQAAAARLGVKATTSEMLTLATPPQRLQSEIAPLCQGAGIDGIIAPGEVAAMAVMAGLGDAGIAVGGEVDVLAKQTSRTFDLYRPRIDTIYEDISAGGEAMGRLLLRRLAGEGAEGLQVLMLPEPNFRL